MTENKETIFLKLGGSLITDKHKALTARPEVIRPLAEEIKRAWQDGEAFDLVLGHGSGSFGHTAGKKYNTRQGVSTREQWKGFAEVWYQATEINRIVIDQFFEAGLPVISFPVSAGLTSASGRKASWDTTPIHNALTNKLIPVVFGDVVFDMVMGGTIFSTEDIFRALAADIPPDRILLAGIEEGVWADYPACTKLLDAISPDTLGEFSEVIQGSAAQDVTGGMTAKVQEMLDLAATIPGLSIQIFSGAEAGFVYRGLLGEALGTRIGN